jgi:multiple sugar transport system substrate-binding protein
MKRSILLALMLCVTAPLIFANGGAEPEPEMMGPVEFDFWTTQTQSDRMATIQVLIDTYMALNPEVSINLVPVDENDIPTQLNAASAAGALPGLVELGAENAVAFGSEGVFDEDATGALLEEIGKDSFYQGVLRLVSSGEGGYYALPYHGWIQGIWYRADWFEEAGLDPPTTWDAIIEAAEYFYKPADNQYGILVGTMAEAFTEQCFTPIAMANGAQLFDREGNLIFNSPEMKEAVEYYAELAQYNPPGPQTWRARDYYIQGKMAMFFYSTYIMDDLAKAEVAAGSLTGENFADLGGGDFDPELASKTGFAPIITNTEPAGYGVVVAMALPKQEKSAVTEAASKFLRYLYTQNAYITYLHMAPGGMNPTIKGISDNARFQNDPSEIFKRYGPEKMNQIVSGMNEIETFSIVDGNRIEAASTIFANQIIPQMLFSITQEGADVDAAMSKAEQEMMKLIE